MNKIELYIDNDERLTIDFFIDVNSDIRMARMKGKECYELIKDICSGPTLNVKTSPNGEELTVTYETCIIHIDEVSLVLGRKGTAPIVRSVSSFFEKQERKKMEAAAKNLEAKKKNRLKVARKNKYISKQIIAGALVLSVLGFVVGKEIHDRKKQDYEIPDSTSIAYETELPTESIEDIITYKQDKNYIVEKIEEVPIQTTEPSYSEPEVETEKQDNKVDVFISFEDTSDTEKAKITRAYYGDILEKYSKMYGVDSEIVTAIATQERGVHSKEKDPGGATGLMQLQNSVWLGNDITAYNYETNKYETLTVKKEMLSDIFYNIKIGCMYFQNCMDYMDNNVLAAIQCYNMGNGSMKKILKCYSAETGKTVDEILGDVTDCGWLEYRNIIIDGKPIPGDPEYLENVLRWIGSEISIDSSKADGSFVNLTISNQSELKNMSYN